MPGLRAPEHKGKGKQERARAGRIEKGKELFGCREERGGRGSSEHSHLGREERREQKGGEEQRTSLTLHINL